MVLIGAKPSLTNNMGIKTTDFVLPLMNSGNKMQMFLPEVEKIWLTTTLKQRWKLNSYLTACSQRVENQRSRDAHDMMATSVLKFISKISG